MRKWIMAAFVLAALAGCASTADDTTPTDDKAATATTPAARQRAPPPPARRRRAYRPARSTGTSAAGGIPASALKDPKNILSKRNIYFDYDQFTVKDEYRPIVEAHAKYLQANRSARAILQGTPTSAARANTTSRWARSAPTR